MYVQRLQNVKVRLIAGLRQDFEGTVKVSGDTLPAAFQMPGDRRIGALDTTRSCLTLEHADRNVLLDTFQQSLGRPTDIREPTAAREKIDNITLRGCR